MISLLSKITRSYARQQRWLSLLLFMACLILEVSCYVSPPLTRRHLILSKKPHCLVAENSSSNSSSSSINESSHPRKTMRNVELDCAPEGSSSEVSSQSSFSMVKWKKKRYLLLNDLHDCIENGDRDSPQKARMLVKRLQIIHEKHERKTDLKHIIQAYNLWIHALAKSKLKNAGDLASDVIQEMLEKEGIQPTPASYVSWMDAYAQSNQPHRVEEIFFDLLEQTEKRRNANNLGNSLSISCDVVLNAWAKQGTIEAARRGQLVLDQLEASPIVAVELSEVSYTTVINGWGRTRSVQGAERAQGLLNRVLQGCNTNSRIPKPNTIMFNAVLNAWALSEAPQAGSKALEVLKQLKSEKLHPDLVTYNSVLAAWSKCGHVNAPKQCERILQELRSDCAIEPNTVSYNTLLHAWGQSRIPGAPQRAQAILEFMEVIADKGGTTISPDTISYTSVLNAWAKSKELNKANHAYNLLHRFHERYQSKQSNDLKPSVFLYNAVLNACAFSAVGTSIDEQRDALRLAVRTFRELQDSPDTSPDSISYGMLIKAFTNLLPMSQEGKQYTLPLHIFEQCTKEGLVSEMVWKEVKRAVPHGALAQHFSFLYNKPIAEITFYELPKSWRRRPSKKKAGPKTLNKEVTKKKEVQLPSSNDQIITEHSYRSGIDL